MKKSKKILFVALTSILLVGAVVFTPLAFGTRPLNEAELLISKNIFASSIDYDKVRIKSGGPLTWIYPGVTIGHVISFPKGEYDSTDTKYQALFLHEMTHVWQFEHIGPIYAPRALFEEITQPDAYVVHYDPEKSFIQYDLEEQAEIVAEFFLTENEIYQEYIDGL